MTTDDDLKEFGRWLHGHMPELIKELQEAGLDVSLDKKEWEEWKE